MRLPVRLRVVVVAVAAVAATLAVAGPGTSASDPWQPAQAGRKFQLFEPRDTLGLSLALHARGLVPVGQTKPSIASPGTSKASARCSKATARRVARPFFVWGKSVRDPVSQVLCGAFTGPGSEAMALAFTAPTCWGAQGWAVFRLSGGDWRLVVARRSVFIFPLVAVGADIRETRPVFRGGDPRCLPSGGKKARIWHWNGTRLVAGAWKHVGLLSAPNSSKGASKQGFF